MVENRMTHTILPFFLLTVVYKCYKICFKIQGYVKFQAVNYQLQNEYYGLITLDGPWGELRGIQIRKAGLLLTKIHKSTRKQPLRSGSVPTDKHRQVESVEYPWQLNTPDFFLNHQYQLQKKTVTVEPAMSVSPFLYSQTYRSHFIPCCM